MEHFSGQCRSLGQSRALGRCSSANRPGFSTQPNNPAKKQGLTLIELTLALTIIAIAIGGLMATLNMVHQRSADPLWQTQAVAIAEAYLEQAMQQAYADPQTGLVCDTPEADRADYDNVCDYDGISDSGANDAFGSPIPELSAYQIQVTVDQNATLNDLTGAAEVLRVDVNVVAETVDIVLSGYRAATQ